MAVSKVILNGTTLIDATTATAAAENIISPYTAMLADGVMTTGTGSGGGVYQEKTVTPTTSTQVVLPDDGTQEVLQLSSYVSSRNKSATKEFDLSALITGNSYRITGTGTATNGYLETESLTFNADVVFQNNVVLPFTVESKASSNVIRGISLSQTSISVSFMYEGDNGLIFNLTFTETGLTAYDALSKVTVNPIPSQYIVPSGTSAISSNGTYDISQFANVEVNVSGGGPGGYEDAIIERTITSYYNSTVSTIGRSAFAGASLEYVEFPNVSLVGQYAFDYCSRLLSVSFPEAITLSNYAFGHCYSLSTISLPEVTSIGSYALGYASNLLNAFIPKARVIEGGAFYQCHKLESAVFSEVLSVGNDAFAYCKSNSMASFPEARSFGDNAFYSNRLLQEVFAPKLNRLGSATFQNCTQLQSVSFPNLSSIGGSVFQNCYSLSTVLLSGKSTYAAVFSMNAFTRCYNLLSLYLLFSVMATLASSNAFGLTPISGNTTSTGGVYGSIFVPASLYDQYISATNWAAFSERFVSMTDEEIAALDS